MASGYPFDTCRKPRTAVLGLLCYSALTALISTAQAQDSLELINSKPTKLTTPNAPLVVDLVHSPNPELVLTDVDGRMKIYDAVTMAELGSVSVEEGALTPPIFGDFNGDNQLEIAVGTQSGRLIVLDGSTLEVIWNVEAGASFSLQPTLVPVEQADGKRRDVIVLLEQNGVFSAWQANQKNELTQLWDYESHIKAESATAVGSIRSQGAKEIVATTGDGYLLILDVFPTDTARASAYSFIVRQNTALPVTPLIVDLDSNGQDEVIVTGNLGLVTAYRWNPTVGRLEEYWSAATAEERKLASRPVASPTLVQAGIGRENRFILQATERGIYVLDANTGALAASDDTTLAGITTHVALIPRSDGLPEIAFGLKRTLQVSRGFSQWVMGRGTQVLQFMSVDLNHQLAGTVATAFKEESDEVVVVGVSLEGDSPSIAYKTPYIVAPSVWPIRSSWMTLSGSPLHNARLEKDFANLEQARRERMATQVAQWEADLKKFMDGSEWDQALAIAAELADYDPYNQGYTSLKRQVLFKRHLIKIILGAIAFLLLVVFTVFKTSQMLTRNHLRRRAENARNRGEYDEARRYYQRLLAKVPRNARVATSLSQVYISQRDYSEETLSVYERAFKANQGDQELLHSFARALLVEPKTDAQARQVYEKALQTFPEPHWLEYGIGRCELAAGNYEEAGKRLRSALRGGVTSEALYRSLCDVYLKTRNFSAKALPVFEQQFPSRREDREFLEGYLLACIDGKKTDGKVESLCQSVLELSPNFVAAYLHLALILLQKNQVGAAVNEVRQALEIDPQNQQALSLLAQCYLIQNRKDEEALKAYRAALHANPADKEVLRMMAQIFFERGQYDQEAVNTYHRSLEHSPNDVVSLKALAQTAQLSNDPDLAIRSIEALNNLGQASQKLVLQLAQAYVKKQVIEPKAERVFREALRVELNNPKYTSALARVYCGQDRTEVDCIQVYEQHLQNYKNDVVIGRQLAKAYIKANRYEKALATTKRFLQIAPEDEELQRLQALGSLYDNKIDEAVADYQRILDRNPNDKDALVNLALAYGQKMRTDNEAIEFYQRALRIQPGNDLLHLAMARVHVDRNDAVKAVDSYKEALRVRDNNEQNVVAHMQAVLTEHPEVLRLRWFFVETLVSYNHFREALEQIEFIATNHPGQSNNILRALETILARDANNVTALLQQGTMLMSASRFKDASKSLEKAYQLRPSEGDVQDKLISVYTQLLEQKEEPETRYKLGQVYFARQEYDNAIGCFQRTSQDYRWEAESTKMLGKCFTGKGMLDLALQEYKKLVVDAETKELLYDLAQRYEGKKDLVGAKTVYRQLFAADINYKDVKKRFEMLSGSTSDPMAFEKTAIVQQMSEEAARRYELLDELGRGAMGIVYRARDKELDEIVALKILPDNMSNNPEAVRRFKIEARNARKLSHPNIVRIHDIGEEMGRKYISMEYVDGSDLKKKVKSAPDFRIPVKDSVKYLMAIADALGYAHRLGIVHRDIKPANIMLTSGDDVKVTDFGIAKMMDQTGEGTMIGAVIGTPLYMSPEQVQGIPVDNRADIYSFGIMMYEMLCGHPPFTEGDLAYQHIHREPEKIEGIPDDLWEICKKCLAKKKEDRWERTEDIYDAIREFQKTAPVAD